MRSLCRLVQVQGDFEVSVKDMLEGLDGLWAQLEELHTGVTLTKEERRDHGDLALARTDTEVSRCAALSTVLWFSVQLNYVYNFLITTKRYIFKFFRSFVYNNSSLFLSFSFF